MNIRKNNLFKINVGNEKYGLLNANCVFQIIELEDKLRAEGKLKTQADVDEFWCNMRKAQVYRKYLLITARQTTLETDTVIHILLTGTATANTGTDTPLISMTVTANSVTEMAFSANSDCHSQKYCTLAIYITY